MMSDWHDDTKVGVQEAGGEIASATSTVACVSAGTKLAVAVAVHTVVDQASHTLDMWRKHQTEAAG